MDKNSLFHVFHVFVGLVWKKKKTKKKSFFCILNDSISCRIIVGLPDNISLKSLQFSSLDHVFALLSF